MTMLDIVVEYLRNNDFDGFSDGDDCACDFDGLAWCDSYRCLNCVASYKNDCHKCVKREKCDSYKSGKTHCYMGPERCLVPEDIPTSWFEVVEQLERLKHHCPSLNKNEWTDVRALNYAISTIRAYWEKSDVLKRNGT